MKVKRKIRSALRLVRSRFSDNSLALLYHRIAEPEVDPFRLCVSPARFREQMEVLRRRSLEVRPVEEFVAEQRAGTLRKGSVCVTFDDGYLDFFEEALPILEHFEIPAVLYCVSGNLGEPFWWDRLQGALREPGRFGERISLESRSGESIEEATSGLKSAAEAFDRFYPFFRRQEPGERERLLRILEKEAASVAPDVHRRLMTEAEIRRLSRHPLVTIGAHTVSHTSLAELDPEAQQAEISGSMRRLGEIIERGVTTFSYPFGSWERDYDEDTIHAARNAGLDHAFAADAGVVTRKSHPFHLPRIWIHDRGADAFERKLKLWLPAAFR